MPIRWQSRVEGDLLIVQASGNDEDLADVEAYGREVIKEAYRTGLRKILCDERALRYQIGLGDTWAAAAALAEQVPGIARVALVHAPESVEAARLWGDTAWTRGVQCHVGTDIEVAYRWLRE